MSVMDSLDGLVDLDHYPLHDLDGPAGRDLVADFSAQLAVDGAIVLPGFIVSKALDAIVTEIGDIAFRAYAGQKQGPIYYCMSGRGFPEDHPR